MHKTNVLKVFDNYDSNHRGNVSACAEDVARNMSAGRDNVLITHHHHKKVQQLQMHRWFTSIQHILKPAYSSANNPAEDWLIGV